MPEHDLTVEPQPGEDPLHVAARQAEVDGALAVHQAWVNELRALQAEVDGALAVHQAWVNELRALGLEVETWLEGNVVCVCIKLGDGRSRLWRGDTGEWTHKPEPEK